MRGLVRFINIFLVLVWIVLLGVLLYKNYAGGELEKEKIKGAFEKRRYWYDVYVGDNRGGFAITEFEKAGNEIIIRHSRKMKGKKNGVEGTLNEELSILTDLSYSIRSFQYSSYFGDEKGIKVTANVDGNDIICFLSAGDKMKTHRIPINGKDFYLPLTLIPILHQNMLVPENPIMVRMLDPLNLNINERKVVLEEIKPLKVGIDVFNVYRFRIGDMLIWSNEMGIIVKESYPSGITIYNSQFEGSMEDSPVKILFDYTTLPSFKSNKVIPNTEALKSLKVAVKGVQLNHQLYENTDINIEGNILNIKREDVEKLQKANIKLPYNREGMGEYLKADEWVRSDYEPLYNTGRIYARTYNHDAFSFVNYINGYLYNLIKTMPLFNLVDSRDILTTLSGDYIERSLMFATYSRSAGLPTRIVSGLVYLKGYFYFHVWPEVWFDRWIPADPTFMQFPADVTHIPLRSGSINDILSLVKELRDIEIEVIEAS
ncbi:MAG: hypothetical protein Fur0020_12810 [Thermodesulfovibrionia bacterium]